MMDFDSSYGSFDAAFLSRRKQAAKNERKAIRRLGMFAGGAILLYVLLQNLLVLVLKFIGMLSLYQNEPLFQAGMDCLLVMTSLLLPFLLVAKPMQAISGTETVFPLGQPKEKGQFLLAIPAGLGFCMLANQITGYLITFLSNILAQFQTELTTPELPMPSGAFGVTVSFFRVVVVAAICEELCFRGAVMQTLRRYGDGFAIVTAAVVFGVMHCNLIQAPFALIAGVALGYLSVKTGTIWTAILIHALNNGLSLAVSYLMEVYSEQAVNFLYLVVVAAIMASGLICFLVFMQRQRRFDAGKRPVRTMNGFWAKLGAYLSSPTMLFAIGLMLYFTAQFVKRTAAG